VPIPNASAPNAPWVEVWLSRQPELGADHVDDPLSAAAGRKEPHAELVAVRAQCVELGASERVRDRPVDGRNIVIHRRDGQIRPPDGTPRGAQPFECLRARHLVHQVQVDVEQHRRIDGRLDDVRVPDLAEEGGAAHRSTSAA